MDEAVGPNALVVDGTNVVTSTPGKPTLSRLESAIGALRAALPSAACAVFVDAHLRHQLSEVEADRLDLLIHSGAVQELPRDGRGSGVSGLLMEADARGAAVVSNDTFHMEREGFPWLSDVDRVIGHSYGGDGWWVFMTRTPSARSSWTGHDAAAVGTGLSLVSRADEAAVVAAASGIGSPKEAIEPDGDVDEPARGTQDARTYDDLVRWSPPATAVVPHDVVRDAVAVLFDTDGARPREELMAAIVTRGLGLTVYGAAALLYRFEGAGILREVEPGTLERSADVTEGSAIYRVSDDIVRDLL